MLRSLALPVACATLLAGCATGYSYRADRGDYYYGRPQVEYRHHGSPWGYGPYGPYRRVPGYGYYGHRGYGYPYGYYGHPYGYGGGYWGYPHPGYPRYVHPRPRPPSGTAPRDGSDASPWRNFDELRRRREGGETTQQVAPSMAQPRMEAPRASRSDGGMGRMLREARERRSASPVAQEQEP